MESFLILPKDSVVVMAGDIKMLAAYVGNNAVKQIVVSEVENATQVKNIDRLVKEQRPDIALVFVVHDEIKQPEGFIKFKIPEPW